MILQHVCAVLFPPRQPAYYSQEVIVPSGQRVRVRSLTYKDGKLWRYYRMRDRKYLEAVEPTMIVSWKQAHTRSAWARSFAYLEELTGEGDIVPLAIEVDGQFAGQISLGALKEEAVETALNTGGSKRTAAAPCWVGYWIAREYQGKGITTAACALICDYGLEVLHLRELTATCLPENIASQKVLEHIGFCRDFHHYPALHVGGKSQLHRFYTLSSGDYHSTCVQRLIRAQRIRRAP
ncbi:MAG: GNAT family protein [Corynebacterium sp.]|nr:GNAT family protein [Corynebacterium sp.]